MSLYGLGIARKHYLTEEAAKQGIHKKQAIIDKLLKHQSELRGWTQGWENTKRPKIARIKKAAKTEIKHINEGEKRQSQKLLKLQKKKRNM